MDCRSIGRIHLESSTAQPNCPDPVLESYFRQRLEQLYAAPSPTLAAHDESKLDSLGGATVENAQGEDEEEYDFRLFTRPSGTASAGTSNVPQRIALRSSSPADGKLGFANGGRADGYYFAVQTDAELAEQYARAAVSGQGIIEGLKMRWVFSLAFG